MTIRPMEGLASEPRLFADLCGHLLFASLVVPAMGCTELAMLLLGPLPGWGYLLVVVGFFLMGAFAVVRWCAAPMDRILLRCDQALPTPECLQRGYRRLLGNAWSGAYRVLLTALALMISFKPFQLALGLKPAAETAWLFGDIRWLGFLAVFSLIALVHVTLFLGLSVILGQVSKSWNGPNRHGG